MKSQIRKWNLALTLLSLGLWGAGVFSRPYLISPHCVQTPANCTPESISALDQPGLKIENSQADGWSYATQNASGILALSIPLLWHGALAARGQIAPLVALTKTGMDWAQLIQVTALNGVGVELSHLLSQRPRPFVIGNSDLARNPSNYTSFYSGHTSFSAAAMTFLFLMLFRNQAPMLVLLLCGALSQGLILATAIFRVLAGRHYVSDVLAGAIAGSLIALGVAYLNGAFTSNSKARLAEPRNL